METLLCSTPRSLTVLSAFVVSTLFGCATAPARQAQLGHPALYQTQAAPAVPAYDNSKAVTGALIGGLVGSQIGRGEGRVANAAIGATAGVMAGQGKYSNESAVGGLIGGLIGSQVGKGEGRVAGAALGAGLGAWLAVPKD